MQTQETFQAVQSLYLGLFAAINLLEVIKQPDLFPDEEITNALDQTLMDQFDHLGAVQSALGIDSVFPDMTQEQIDQLAMDRFKVIDQEIQEAA